MQNSGVEKSEAAACKHSQASLGLGRACVNAHYSMSVQTPFDTPQPGSKRPGPRDTSPRVSELFRRPHNLTENKADISGDAQEPFNKVPDLYYCYSTSSQTVLRTFYCTLWSLTVFLYITFYEKQNLKVKKMSKLAKHILHQNIYLLKYFLLIFIIIQNIPCWIYSLFQKRRECDFATLTLPDLN